MRKSGSIRKAGFPANTIVIPLVFVIAILHIVIISLVFEVNRANGELSEMMQKCSDYQQNATNLQASSSTLSETAAAFAQVPVGTDGEFNSGPLIRYAQELGRDRRGPKVAEWFREQGVSPEIQACIDTAAADSEQMYEIQLHAVALLCSVYPRPPISELSAIPEVPLTEEELAMPEEARTASARSMILGKDYSLLKASVAENVENCHRTVQQEYSRAFAESQSYINNLRVGMRIVIAVIIAIMIGTFVLAYRWLIMPLRRFASKITSDQSVERTKSRILEMRVVVNAYNALLGRRDKLESILRSAAETDALTELPNRYSLRRDVLQTGEEDGSVAVLQFDVNYLKRANDTEGHSAGDRLLRTAAACIRECFAADGHGSCYRIGGDEFIAVLRKCSEEEVRRRIERFSLATERENVSVSVGYAFAEQADENSFDRLLEEADQRMYAQKKHVHALDRAAGKA